MIGIVCVLSFCDDLARRSELGGLHGRGKVHDATHLGYEVALLEPPDQPFSRHIFDLVVQHVLAIRVALEPPSEAGMDPEFSGYGLACVQWDFGFGA